MLTDVRGVLGPDGNLIPEMTVAEVKKGIADGWISGGMIPKVETCIYAVEKGVKMILDQNPDLIFFTGDLVNNKASEMDEIGRAHV